MKNFSSRYTITTRIFKFISITKGILVFCLANLKIFLSNIFFSSRQQYNRCISIILSPFCNHQSWLMLLIGFIKSKGKPMHLIFSSFLTFSLLSLLLHFPLIFGITLFWFGRYLDNPLSISAFPFLIFILPFGNFWYSIISH